MADLLACYVVLNSRGHYAVFLVHRRRVNDRHNVDGERHSTGCGSGRSARCQENSNAQEG
jgi:hypothetical protein